MPENRCVPCQLLTFVTLIITSNCLVVFRRRKKEQVDEDDDDYDDDEVEDISAPAIKGDNICGWSKMVIKRYTGCKDQDILHATFNSEVSENSRRQCS